MSFLSGKEIELLIRQVSEVELTVDICIDRGICGVNASVAALMARCALRYTVVRKRAATSRATT